MNNNLEEKQIEYYNAIIKDEVLEPYFIKINNDSFEIYKNIQRTKLNSDEKFEAEEFISCYSNFINAIKRIIFLKSWKKGDIYTLKNYIERYKEIEKEIILKIPEIKIN